MVSFFGLKIGGDKKKKSERVIKPVLKSPWRQDPDPRYEEFFGDEQNHPFPITGLDTPPSRPGTAMSSRSSRSGPVPPSFASPYLTDGGASSMVDLPSMRHRARGSTSSFFRSRPMSSADTSCVLTGEDMSARPTTPSGRRPLLPRAGTPTGPLSLVLPNKTTVLPKSSLANSETIDGSVVTATSPTTEKPATTTVVAPTGAPKLPQLDSHTALPTPPDSVTGSLEKSTRGDVSPLEDTYRSHSSTLRSMNNADTDKPVFPPVSNSYEAPRPAPLPSPALSPALSPAANNEEPDANPWTLPKVKTVSAHRDPLTISSARQKSVSMNIEHPEKSPFADFKFSNDDDEDENSSSPNHNNHVQHRGRDVTPVTPVTPVYAEDAPAKGFSEMNPEHVPAPLQPHRPTPSPAATPPAAQPSGWPLRWNDAPNSNSNTVESHSTNTLHLPPHRRNDSSSREDPGQRGPASRGASPLRGPMLGDSKGNPVHNQIHHPRQRPPMERGRQGPQFGPGPTNAPPNMHHNQDPNRSGPNGFGQQQPPYRPHGAHRSPMGRPGPRPGPPAATPPRFDSAGHRPNGAAPPPNFQAAGPHGPGPFTRQPPRGMGPRATPRPAPLNSPGPRGAPTLSPPHPVGAQAQPRSPRTPRLDPDLPRPHPIIDISDFSGPELDLSFTLPSPRPSPGPGAQWSGPSSPQRSPRPRMESGAEVGGNADWPLPSPALRSPMSMSPVLGSPVRSGLPGSPLSPVDKGGFGDDAPLPMPPPRNPLRAASPGPGRLPRRDMSGTQGSTFI